MRIAACIVVIVLLFPTAAGAQEPDLVAVHAEAQRLAKEAAADGRVEDALAILTAANDKGDNPVSWFLIGRLHAAVDRCSPAVDAFGHAARAQNDEPLANLAQEEIEKLKAVCPGVVKVVCNPPELAVQVEGTPRACGGTFELPPGTYEATASFQGESTQKVFDVVALETVDLDLKVEVPDAEPVAPIMVASEPPDILLYAGWPITAAGVAVLGTSVFLLVQHEEDVKTLQTAGPEEYDRLAGDARSRADLIPILYGVGGVLVAGGATMLLMHWLWDAGAEAPPEPGSVHILVGPSAIGFGGTF